MEAVTTFSTEVGVQQACMLLGIARGSYYRYLRPKAAPTKRPRPDRALTETERESVLQILNSEEFCDTTPRQIWATLLDRGTYVAHWRTMYRILTENGEVKERRDQLCHPLYETPELLATGANELWSWDITRLRGPEKWSYYYLYVIVRHEALFNHVVVQDRYLWPVAAGQKKLRVTRTLERGGG